jgi:hypothetical protein
MVMGCRRYGDDEKKKMVKKPREAKERISARANSSSNHHHHRPAWTKACTQDGDIKHKSESSFCKSHQSSRSPLTVKGKVLWQACDPVLYAQTLSCGGVSKTYSNL